MASYVASIDQLISKKMYFIFSYSKADYYYCKQS